jgi:hypothetical protein
MENADEVKALAEKNYRLAQEHFSLEVLQQKLAEILRNF